MRKWKILAFVLCFVLSLSLLGLGAGARSVIEPEREVALSLIYDYQETSFPDLDINLYRVASIDITSAFTKTEHFAKYALPLNTVKSQSEWNQVAQTAMSYVIADEIPATATAVTDANGVAQFEDLSTGLYLVERCRADYEKGYCVFDSFMIILPGVDENDEWTYDVSAHPKAVYDEEVEDRPIEYTVIKLWKDVGYEYHRPKEVEIELYKDGTYIETVVLGQKNDWAYTWETIDDGAVWTVVESYVPEGYTVAQEQRGNTFVVINSYNDIPPPPTGDATSGNLVLIACAIVGLGLIVLGAVVRRRV